MMGTTKNGHRSSGTPDSPTCFRFDSVLFTPKMPAIAGCFNFSRSPDEICRRDRMLSLREGHPMATLDTALTIAARA
jgi:hypothetical protein